MYIDAMKMKTIEYTLPAPWASYLINGDASGLTGSEEFQIDGFLAKHNLPAPVGCSENTWFARSNDSGNDLAGDVMTFTFLI